jgi:predicted nucleic acid-binding protein
MTPDVVYLDSNVFFYSKIMDKRYGPDCAKLLRRVQAGEIKGAISSLVVLEVANALRRFGFSKEAQRTCTAILSMPLVVRPLSPESLHEALDIFQRLKISPYDCAHLATMKELGLRRIVSADSDFDAAEWIERIDPLKLDEIPERERLKSKRSMFGADPRLTTEDLRDEDEPHGR